MVIGRRLLVHVAAVEADAVSLAVRRLCWGDVRVEARLAGMRRCALLARRGPVRRAVARASTGVLLELTVQLGSHCPHSGDVWVKGLPRLVVWC